MSKDQKIIEAIAAQNNGHHTTAAKLFRDAGNQERLPEEKATLWAAADRAERIARSD